MRSFFKVLAVSNLIFAAAAGTSLSARASENPLFGYTHMLSSPFTLPAGKVVLGTDAALGITDFLQVGTNVVLDIYQTYNVGAKLSVLDFPAFALAVTGSWVTYNFANFSPLNPDVQVTSWLPGVVTAYSLIPDVALFVGGNLNITKTALTTPIETSGYFRGASGEADLSWAYNPKKRSIGNVLSAGTTYDFTYKIFGFGVSHHWRGFHLGVHYYPNASLYKVLPIISGGMAVDI